MDGLPPRDQDSTRTETAPSSFSTAKSFLLSVLGYAGKKALTYFTMMVLLGLTEGVGILMFIPLLNLIGFEAGPTSNTASHYVRAFFDMAGLPLTLETVLCAYIAIVGAHAIAGRYLETLNARLSFGYTKFMQDRLYNAFLRVDGLCSAQMSGVDVIRVLTNDLTRAGFAGRQLLELIATVALTLIYTGVVLTISWVMALFVLASIGMILLFLRPYNRKAHDLGEVYQSATRNLYFVANEHVNGIKIARSYGLQSEHAARFSAITKEAAEKGIHFLQVDAATQMYHQIGATVALSAFCLIGAKFIAISTSSIVLVAFVFARLSPKVSLIQHFTQFISNSLPAYRAATQMLSRFEISGESPAPAVVPPLPLGSAIRLDRVSFSYSGNGDNRALRGIDLSYSGAQHGRGGRSVRQRKDHCCGPHYGALRTFRGHNLHR
ncbi:MAG: ABC transporter transmembrane domain-containing protein [Syntrophobacteraceae bacterium]